MLNKVKIIVPRFSYRKGSTSKHCKTRTCL